MRLMVAGGSVDVTRVTRRPTADTEVRWHLGAEPPPRSLSGHWDVVVHAAASTRWTMTTEEAEIANIRPMEAVLDLVQPDTHMVHVSTAYLDEQAAGIGRVSGSSFDGWRNGYEWSKARCEALLRERHAGPITFVRPPLVLGRRTDGAIARFSGPYTLFHALVSGLAAVVVGDPEGYAEIAPVDQVAEAIVGAALADTRASPQTAVVAGGATSMQLRTLIDVTCATLTELRAPHGAAPVHPPPFISTQRWHRFFLPFARQHLSPVQNEAAQLLGMFESYTSMARPFTPTHQVVDPVDVLVQSIRWWALRRPRLALRRTQGWALMVDGNDLSTAADNGSAHGN